MKLKKAAIGNPEWSMNDDNLEALFTARGEMIRASSYAFIEGKIDYTHACCWKVPHDEPFTGVNAEELKEELTRKQLGGVLELQGGVLAKKGEIKLDPSLLDLIMSNISKWSRDQMKAKDGNYHREEFLEVYDFKYSVSAVIANTAVYLEVSYI
jgi:hypothetical protein